MTTRIGVPSTSKQQTEIGTRGESLLDYQHGALISKRYTYARERPTKMKIQMSAESVFKTFLLGLMVQVVHKLPSVVGGSCAHPGDGIQG